MLSPTVITNSNGKRVRSFAICSADLILIAVAGAEVAEDCELERVGTVRELDDRRGL